MKSPRSIFRLNSQVNLWKWHFSAFALLILCISCIRGPREPGVAITAGDGQTAADYRIAEVTGTSAAESMGTIWKTPTQKTYDFRVCLTAKTTNARLPVGQSFEIEKADGTIFQDKTDNLGCITWKEALRFNFSADSMYIERVRKLRGRGSFKGEALVKMAVNPWVEYRGEDDPEIIDLARRSVPERYLINEDMNGDLASGFISENSGQDILVDADLNLKVTPGIMLRDGHRIQMILKLKPYIQPLNMRGGRTKVPLDSGEFLVRAQLVGDLIGEKQDEHGLLTELMPKTVEINGDNTIVFDVKTDLKRRITEGRVRLALQVVPLHAPMTLRPYSGLHDVGLFSDVAKGGAAVRIKGPLMAEKFNYPSYIESASNFADLVDRSQAQDLPPVLYSQYDARFVRVKTGETATRRTIIYLVRTQVTNSLTGSPVARIKFPVKKANGEILDPMPESDENGYLEWNEELEHLYYQPEQYFFPKTVITHIKSQNKHTVELAINPWDWGWTFGQDLRQGKPLYRKLSKDEIQPSRFVIDAFRYQTIRFRYVIDQFMTLNVKKAVVMTFDPLVQRYSIKDGRIREPLRDGVYLMKVALVKYYIDPFQNSSRLIPEGAEIPGTAKKAKSLTLVRTKDSEDAAKGRYLTIIKKLVRVQGSRITTPMEFSMRDLRMMSIRSTLFVEIEAIDESRLMSTNLMSEKLDRIERLYFDANPHLTGAEKELYKDIQAERYTEESEAIARGLKPELEKLERQRLSIREADFERFSRLRELEANGLKQDEDKRESQDALKQKYDSLFALSKKEFEATMATARAGLGDMQKDLNSYWEEWQDEYRENMLNPNGIGLLGRSATEKAGLESRAGYVRKKLGRIKNATDAPLLKTVIRGGIPEGEVTDRGEEIKVDPENYLLPIPEENARAAKSVYDFLGIMNTFAEKSPFPIYVDNEDVGRLKVNNYIENPAAPFIDLDLYVDKTQTGFDDRGNPTYEYESGLQRRTFIGPCTLVENDNMSDMRPTDVIDEMFCDRIDCSEQFEQLVPEIDNSEFEDSVYNDSLKPFADMHVDHLEGLYIENETWYQSRMNLLSQLGNYARTYNLDYVSLTDKPFLMYKEECSFVERPEDCLITNEKDRMSADIFTTDLNADQNIELLRRYFYVHSMKKLKNAFEASEEENSLGTLRKKLFFETGNLVDGIKKKLSDWLPVPYQTLAVDAELDMFVKKMDKIPEDFKSSQAYGRDAQKFLQDHPELKEKTLDGQNLADYLDKGASELDLTYALKICRFLARRNIKSLQAQDLLLDFKPDRENGNPLSYLTHLCFRQIAYSPKSESIALLGLAIDRRFRVVKTGPYQHKAGKNMNIQVGRSFSISKGDERSRATTVGISNSGLIGAAFTGAGSIAGAIKGASAGSKVGGFAGAGIGGLIGGVVSSVVSSGSGVTSAQAQQIGRASSVDNATFLVVQKADMDIALHEYEKCLTIKMSNEAIAEIDPKDLRLKNPENFDASAFSDDPVQKTLSRGVLVCSGKVYKYKNPESVKSYDEAWNAEHTIRESYFYVTQHFTAGEMLDDANLLNHVWLLALRGQGDFETFTRLVEYVEVDEDGEKIEKDEVADYPLSRLEKVYNEVLPSFPGLHSVPN